MNDTLIAQYYVLRDLWRVGGIEKERARERETVRESESDQFVIV